MKSRLIRPGYVFPVFNQPVSVSLYGKDAFHLSGSVTAGRACDPRGHGPARPAPTPRHRWQADRRVLPWSPGRPADRPRPAATSDDGRGQRCCQSRPDLYTPVVRFLAEFAPFCRFTMVLGGVIGAPPRGSNPAGWRQTSPGPQDLLGSPGPPRVPRASPTIYWYGCQHMV